MKAVIYSPHVYAFVCKDHSSLPYNKELIDWVLNGKKYPLDKELAKKVKYLSDLEVKYIPDDYEVTDWLSEVDKLGGDKLRFKVLLKAKELSLEGKPVVKWEAYSVITGICLPVMYDMRRFIPFFDYNLGIDDLINNYYE